MLEKNDFFRHIRHISRHVKVDVAMTRAMNFTQPVEKALMHIVLHHKYNTYQVFAINLWEDVCSWMSRIKKSYYLDWTLNRIFNIHNLSINNTNINHLCPYEGYVYVQINNISVDQFPFEQVNGILDSICSDFDDHIKNLIDFILSIFGMN